jgi:hypothetical protein
MAEEVATWCQYYKTFFSSLMMTARPEPSQLEYLSDASFLGKILVLPANVRLDWKVIARYKHSSLLGLVFCNEEKKFYNIDIWCQYYKTFFSLLTKKNRMCVPASQSLPKWSTFQELSSKEGFWLY